MRTKYDLISIFTTVGLFAILEVTSILLIANNSIVQKIELFDKIRSFQAYFWSKEQQVSHYFNYRSVNAELFEENLRLKNEMSAYREMLNFAETSIPFVRDGFRYLGARIVKNTVNSQHNYLIINKGDADGVRSGMGIVTQNGVIGVVSSTSSHYSYVLSFLNITQNISVKLTGTGTFGPMSWNGKSAKGATIREIPTHINISVQDTVVTSGYSSIFPPDIPLGTVESVSSSDGLSQNVLVNLFEDFQSLDFVYVVSNDKADEIMQLQQNEQ